MYHTLANSFAQSCSFVYRTGVIFAMAGAGKVGAQSQSSSSAPFGQNEPQNQPDGFGGPCDVQSTAGRPSHGFGPGLGHDPGRGSPSPLHLQFTTLFELPSEAYHDPSKKVSLVPTLYSRFLFI